MAFDLVVQAVGHVQCSRASTLHSLGIIGIVAAVILVLAGVIAGVRSRCWQQHLVILSFLL